MTSSQQNRSSQYNNKARMVISDERKGKKRSIFLLNIRTYISCTYSLSRSNFFFFFLCLFCADWNVKSANVVPVADAEWYIVSSHDGILLLCTYRSQSSTAVTVSSSSYLVHRYILASLLLIRSLSLTPTLYN